MPITHEARSSYVTGVMPIVVRTIYELWTKGISLEHATVRHTPLYRLTSLWKGTNETHSPNQADADAQRWFSLLEPLEDILHCCPTSQHAIEASPLVLTLFQPVITPKIDRDVSEWPDHRVRPFGCFTYYLRDDDRRIELHFANPFSPQSPFADVDARRSELASLINHAMKQAADVEYVSCESWLNEHAEFQRLFPPSWNASGSKPRPLTDTSAWWGQFIDRRGAFHRPNGEYAMRTGQFPYQCISCRIPVARLIDHLTV